MLFAHIDTCKRKSVNTYGFVISENNAFISSNYIIKYQAIVLHLPQRLVSTIQFYYIHNDTM